MVTGHSCALLVACCLGVGFVAASKRAAAYRKQVTVRVVRKRWAHDGWSPANPHVSPSSVLELVVDLQPLDCCIDAIVL